MGLFSPHYIYPDGPPGGKVRILNLESYLPDERAFQVPDRTEGDQCLAAIFANPFDAGPRGGLADWLDEEGVTEDWAAHLRDYPGDCYYSIPPLKSFKRWAGPGFLGCPQFGTVNVWAGSFAQFPQACRSRLFIDYPITLIIPTDREPLKDGKTFVWCDSETILRRMGQHSTRYQDANFALGAYRHVINELCGVFMAQEGQLVTPDGGGVYRANNRICANLALSNALVNIGRYTVGLPTLRFPDQAVQEYAAGNSRVFCGVMYEGTTWGNVYQRAGDEWRRIWSPAGDSTVFPEEAGCQYKGYPFGSIWKMIQTQNQPR